VGYNDKQASDDLLWESQKTRDGKALMTTEEISEPLPEGKCRRRRGIAPIVKIRPIARIRNESHGCDNRLFTGHVRGFIPMNYPKLLPETASGREWHDQPELIPFRLIYKQNRSRFEVRLKLKGRTFAPPDLTGCG
jgi:hypothetical protein